MTFTIRWPAPAPAARPRTIPASTQSIVIVITQRGQTVASQTLARPAEAGDIAYTFQNLPVGPLTATATAYSNVGGSEMALAAGATNFTAGLITGGAPTQPAQITINLVVPVARLSADASLLLVGGKAVVTAVDSDGNALPATQPGISGSDLTWQTSSGAAAVAGSGNPVTVQGLAVSPGVTITVTQASTGKSVSQTFRVIALLGNWSGTISYIGGGSDPISLQITQRPDDSLSVFVVSPSYNNDTFLQSPIGSNPGVDFDAGQTPVVLNVISGTVMGDTITGDLINPNAVFVNPGLPQPFTVTRQ